MVKVFWTGQAEVDILALSVNIADLVLEKINNVRHYPEMYPRMAGEKWEGCRKIFIKPHWIIVYKILSDSDVVILYIRDSRF